MSDDVLSVLDSLDYRPYGAHIVSVVREAKKEITRLRARIAELEAWQKMVCELPTIEMAEARAVVSQALAALARLGGNDSTEHRLAKSASQHIDMALAAQTRRLMNRIAKLEDRPSVEMDDGKVVVLSNAVIITEEQIDAAWEFNEDSNAMTKAHGRAMLYTLGIVACEMCGGDGEIQEGVGYPSSDGGEEWQLVCCPACHRNGKSHGWVWAAAGEVLDV